MSLSDDIPTWHKRSSVGCVTRLESCLYPLTRVPQSFFIPTRPVGERWRAMTKSRDAVASPRSRRPIWNDRNANAIADS